jgi:hypothetical protein
MKGKGGIKKEKENCGVRISECGKQRKADVA